MAIIAERVEINGIPYIHTYSDDDVLIHGGVPEGDYADVYDPVNSGRTYVETSIQIDETVDELKNKIVEWKTKYNIAEARAKQLDRIKSQIEALRDSAVLPTTKAIYDAILDLFEDGD